MNLPQSLLYPLVILFTLGAIFSFYIDLGTTQLSGFLVVFLGLQIVFQRTKLFNTLKSLLLYLSFFVFGCIHFQEYYRLPSDHFQFQIKNHPEALKTIEIVKTIGQSSFSSSYIGRIIRYGENETDGVILINQKKDSFTKPYSIGQILLTYESIQTVSEPLNPGSFSFKNYLENQRVYHQINVHKENSIETPNTSFSLGVRIQQLRETLIDRIQNSKLNTESKGMIQALLLAQRKALNSDTIENYSKAGVIHLLALSGLHIGIFVGLLWMVFRPFLFWKYGHTLRSVTILFFLWSYAFLIGFPASVVRAVTLFSFIVIGKWIHYGKNSFHYTVLSFWILVLIYPPLFKVNRFPNELFGCIWDFNSLSYF